MYCPITQPCNRSQIFKRCKGGLNSELAFFLIAYRIKYTLLSLSNYLPINPVTKDGFMSFSRTLARSEIVSFRI